MTLLEILVHIFVSALIFMSAAWTFFPWGFGVVNFKQCHGKGLGQLASLCWYVFLVAHPVALVLLWISSIPVSNITILLAVMHLIFSLTFARNISTR